MKNLINTSAPPFIPEGWSVEEHTGMGEIELKPGYFGLYVNDQQKNAYIEGNKLRKDLAGKPVLNANVLDYLLKNPHLIPEEWKGKYIFFWGTIYRNRVGDLCVRYLYWNDGRWHWGHYWLSSGWSSRSPAAVRASAQDLDIENSSGTLPSALPTEFSRIVEPVIKWMNELHPHHTIIITGTDAELLEGKMAHATHEFLKD